MQHLEKIKYIPPRRLVGKLQVHRQETRILEANHFLFVAEAIFPSSYYEKQMSKSCTQLAIHGNDTKNFLPSLQGTVFDD